MDKSDAYWFFLVIVTGALLGFIGGAVFVDHTHMEQINKRFCAPLCTANETPSVRLGENGDTYVCSCTSVRSGVEK